MSAMHNGEAIQQGGLACSIWPKDPLNLIVSFLVIHGKDVLGVSQPLREVTA